MLLLDVLSEEGLLDRSAEPEPPDLARAVHGFLRRTPAHLVCLPRAQLCVFSLKVKFQMMKVLC